VVTTSHRDDETFAFAGPAGSTGTATWSGGNQGTRETATASVTPPPMPSGGMDLTAAQAPQLIYEEAVAVGTPAAAAQQMAFGSSVTISSPSNVTGSNAKDQLLREVRVAHHNGDVLPGNPSRYERLARVVGER